MRMTFDSTVPRVEQLLRASGRKKVGRKHNHTRGPSKAKELILRRGAHKAFTNRQRYERFRERVRAYWRGEADTHP